jgi:biotin operon repressor
MGINQQNRASERKSVVLRVLSRHLGKGNGISMHELEQQLDLMARHIRAYISELREEGHAICGTPRDGYYMAATPEELRETTEFLIHRAKHSLNLASKLTNIPLPNLLGQLHLTTQPGDKP